MNYNKLRDKVAVLVGKYGMPMTMRVIVPGVYDPASGSKAAPGTPADYPCFGMVGEYTLRDIDGTLIKTGDKKVILSASDSMPDPVKGNLLIMGGETWNVENSRPTAPAGISVVYDVQVRP